MPRTCARCGQPVDGYAQIGDDWYCHPDDPTKDDCYSLAERPPSGEWWEVVESRLT